MKQKNDSNQEKTFRRELAALLSPDYLLRTGQNALQYTGTFLKWLLLSAVIGLVCGGVGALFHHSIDIAASAFSSQSRLIWLLPLAGILIAWLYRVTGVGEQADTNLVLTAVRGEKDIPLLLAPLIFISTVVTHLCGGSAGREGAALQLGGTIGIKTGKLFRLKEKSLPLSILCGMSGVFAALFGTPLTAAFFATEVISVGIYYHASLVPCLVSSLTAYQVALLLGVTPVGFVLEAIPGLTVTVLLKVLLLSALCAVLSILFCKGMHSGAHLLKRVLPNAYLRGAAGGLLLILLTLLTGSRDYNGAGMSVIVRAIGGECCPEAFLLKFLFTVITLGSGFKGGEIVPSFFIGATFGCLMGPIVGLDPGFAAAIGLISVFCGCVNCPIASVFMSFEMFGGAGLLFFALACGVSYALSGYTGLYSSQKIVYSKLQAEYINRSTD